MVSPVSITNVFNGDISAANLVNAAALDTQLTNLAATVNAEIAERQRTVRDGSGLASQVVRFPALHPEITSLLVAGGARPLQAVSAVSVTNVASLAGLLVVDGYTLLAADRVLLTGQTNPIQNGIWLAAASAWTRPLDSATGVTLPLYSETGVVNGNTQSASIWLLNPSATVDSASQKWAIFSSNATVIPISRGGTGATTAIAARSALGLSTLATAGLTVSQSDLNTDVQYRVDTIAALKALTTTYATVLVLGYYAAGDGGAGIFRWNSADSTSDNLGTTVIPNSAPGIGRWNRVYSGDVNVRWFGAKGDNVVSDTPFLNSAASFVASVGGGTLYIPKGIYRMDTQFLVNGSNISIRGDGMGATVLRCNAWVDGIQVANGYPSATGILYDISIMDLSINGDRASHANGPNDTYGNGININACDQVVLRNCEVYNQEQQGIVSTFWQVAGVKQNSIVIESCIVKNTQLNRIAIGIEGRGRAARIANNSIINGGSLYVGHALGTGTDNGETLLVGNRIEGVGNTTGYGITITDNMYNCSIIGNLVTGYDIGIRMSSNGGPLSSFIVNENIVIGFNSYGILAGPMNGADSSYVMVSNNKLTSAAGIAAIGLYKNASATGNRVDGVLGIGISCADNGNQIIGNTITSTGYSISLGSTTGNQVLCNYLSTQVDSAASPLLNSQFGNYGSTVNRGSDYYIGTARVTSSNAVPTTGTWALGDTVVNSAPGAGSNSGWVCVAAGTPGTWVRFGVIFLDGNAVIDPPSLGAGAEQTLGPITVTGAALGDFVIVSAPNDLQGCMVIGYVSAANTVTIRQRNGTAGAIDLASGTWRARVEKQ